MAETARPRCAPTFISCNLVMLLLVLTTMKGPLTRKTQDLDTSNRFRLGKSLAAPKIPKDWTKLQARSRLSKPTPPPRAKAFKVLKVIQFCSIASLAILLSGDVCPNHG